MTQANEGNTSDLKHGLKSRHLTMISIAGVIGGSLFIGSGNVIASAGPAAVIAYALGGLLILLVMRMLGEMAVLNPDTGSFSTYAQIVRLDVGQVLPSVGYTGVHGHCSWVGKPMLQGKS